MSSQQNPNKDPTTDGLILIALFIGVYFLLQFLLFEDLKYQRLTLYKYYITAYKFVLDFIYVPQFIDNLYDQLTIYEPKEISKELFDSIKYRMFLLVDLPILALLAFIFIKGGSKVKKFNNIYTLKSFINAQKELWQWLYPIADLDMKNGKFDLDIHIEDGEWAMAKRPLHFCKIYGLLNENHSVIESNASIVYANQVGRLYTSFEDLKDYPQNEVCILSSGDQGEPIEAMKNIAEKKIDGIQIESGDTIMIAATPSPNMEVMLFQTLNLLVKLGANVVTASKRLHAASHATKEELKMMLNMLMPKHFIPVQGEFRNLRKHAEIAAETGVVAENIHILAKGTTLELSGNKSKTLLNNIPVGNILVDGRGIGDVEDSVLKDRKLLSNDGIFVASYAISRKEKTLVGRPVIQTKGFVYVKKSMELIKEAEEKIIEYLENNPIKSIRECAAVKAEIRSMLSSLLYDNTKRKPIIIINFSLI